MVLCSEFIDKATGDLKARSYASMFIKGIGGFGHKGKMINKIPAIPDRAPDAVSEFKT